MKPKYTHPSYIFIFFLEFVFCVLIATMVQCTARGTPLSLSVLLCLGLFAAGAAVLVGQLLHLDVLEAAKVQGLEHVLGVRVHGDLVRVNRGLQKTTATIN
jgi:hypothetical protein